MSSKYSIGTARRNTPSWCFPGMFPRKEGFVAARPTAIHCFARWKDFSLGATIDVIETFSLQRNDANNGWSGGSGTSGPNLQVEVLDLAASRHYDLHLTYRTDTTYLDDVSWHDVEVPHKIPWTTGVLEHVWIPSTTFDQLLLMA